MPAREEWVCVEDPVILTLAEKKKILVGFARWLDRCNGRPLLVRVQGVEGGHPYDRKVSVTDAVTDFLWFEDMEGK